MRFCSATAILVAALSLAGCGVPDWANGERSKIYPTSMSLGDRCFAILQAAIPFADLKPGKLTSQNKGIDLIVAQAEATRTDHTEDALMPRDLAAECEFDNNVLTGFRWIRGGPQR
jgi:hypothetical protein